MIEKTLLIPGTHVWFVYYDNQHEHKCKECGHVTFKRKHVVLHGEINKIIITRSGIGYEIDDRSETTSSPDAAIRDSFVFETEKEAKKFCDEINETNKTKG